MLILFYFLQILVNAADNKVRDAKMDTIKIDIDPEKNEIKVSWNNNLLTKPSNQSNYDSNVSQPFLEVAEYILQ